MFRTLKDLLSSLTEDPAALSPEEQTHQLQRATAVLRAEPELDAAERSTLVRTLREKLGLCEDEIDRLIELAQDTAKTAYDYQRFTGQLNDRFSQKPKIRVVEAMWQVACADGHLDANENHVIRKVAGLLRVTHGECIAAKGRAKAAAEL
jgi:uncharacterized tellurite resistance protein B-like protein